MCNFPSYNYQYGIELKEKKTQILLLGMGGMTYVGRGRRIGERGIEEGLGIEGEGGVQEERRDVREEG